MDNILIATVLIIFFTALLSRIVQRFDRVLKSIRNFHITIVKKDQKKLWGNAKIYANGMKLLFSKPYQSSGGAWVDSYIFYQAELEQVQLIYRYHDELSPENRQRRLAEIKKVSKPGNIRRAIRQLRNFISNFQEAFSETLGVFLNRMKSSAGDIIKTTEKHLKQAGSTAIGAVGKEYDQILEKHINKKVVVSLNDGKVKQEYAGFLGEYSAKWIALLHCSIERNWQLPLNDMNRLILNRNLDVSFKIISNKGDYALELEISNYGQKEVRLKRIKGEDFIQNIYKTIKKDETIKTTISQLPKTLFPEDCEHILDKKIENIAPERGGHYHPEMWRELKDKLPNLNLIYNCERRVDVYLPRSIATVRHSVAM
jgi:small nuclear ribonucleoprotein (snRNP)-like protein